MLDFGPINRSGEIRSLSTGFLTKSQNIAWFCEDNHGFDHRLLTIQSSNIENTTTHNPNHTIPASSVAIKNPAAYKEKGSCTFGIGDSNGERTSIASAKTILDKIGSIGEGCKIITDNLSLKVDLAASQAIGQYSGTLTINLPNF